MTVLGSGDCALEWWLYFAVVTVLWSGDCTSVTALQQWLYCALQWLLYVIIG